MLWTIALILFTIFLFVMVASFRNLGGSFEGVYEETKDQVGRDARPNWERTIKINTEKSGKENKQ